LPQLGWNFRFERPPHQPAEAAAARRRLTAARAPYVAAQNCLGEPAMARGLARLRPPSGSETTEGGGRALRFLLLPHCVDALLQGLRPSAGAGP
jgi:hypothetical protein